MKRKILVAAMTAATVALSGLAAGIAATSASAASSGKDGAVSVSNVVFSKGQTSKKATIAYRSKFPDWYLDFEITDPHGNWFDFGGDSGDAPTKRTTSSWIYYWDGYGKYTVDATFYDEGTRESTYRDTFCVKRATYLAVNVTPEPVKKGRYATVKGTVKYWSPDSGKIQPLKNKKVSIYFDPTGPKKAVYKGSDTVDGKGVFSKKIRQYTKGTWVVKYAGTTGLTPDVARDIVNIKK